MKRLLLLLILVVAAVVLAFMSLPEDPDRREMDIAPIEETGQDEEAARLEALQAEIEVERDRRLEEMKVEYARLERKRRDLRNRLEVFTYYLGQADVPGEKLGEIQEEIGAANRLLVNPPLLGAFRGPDDIVEESGKIDRIHRKLDEYEVLLREHGAYDSQ